MKQSKSLVTILLGGYVFLYLPLLIVILFSFNQTRLISVWSGFSLRWYQALWHNEMILSAAWTSLSVAFISATFSVILGLIAALFTVRYRSKPRHGMVPGLMIAPMMMPEVIFGLSLLLFFVSLESIVNIRGMVALTIAHTTIGIAYVFVLLRERLGQYDMSMEEAALDLGASRLSVVFRIMMPAISSSLIAGWLLAFTLSLDDVVLASFVSGAEATTLPMIIFSSVRMGITPEINALATIMLLFVITSLALSLIFYNLKNKQTV